LKAASKEFAGVIFYGYELEKGDKVPPGYVKWGNFVYLTEEEKKERLARLFRGKL